MRARHLSLAVIAVVLVFVWAPAWAEEILYFTNGTTMPIRGHEIKGQMIHIDLGDESSMAFPLTMVEKVEEAGKDVRLDAGGGNRRFGGPHPVTGSVPPRERDTADRMGSAELPADPNVQRDKGVAVYRPHAGGPANKARVGYAGNQAVLNGQGRYQGTKTMGTRNVVGVAPNAPKSMSRRSGGAAEFAAKQSGGGSSQPKSTGDDKGEGSASGSESDE